MIKGIGVDIIEIARIKENLSKQKFMQRIFTSHEITYCQPKANPEVHFAGRFAAKEAILKALGTGLSGLSWTDIEVLPDSKGVPRVQLHTSAGEIARQQGITEVLVSISHSDNYAVAYATAL